MYVCEKVSCIWKYLTTKVHRILSVPDLAANGKYASCVQVYYICHIDFAQGQ